MQKGLGNLQAAAEADKIIGRLKIKADFKDAEIDALDQLNPEDLANKLDELKADRDRRLKEMEV